ncbi:MAG: DUF6498-containing protein [Actinomycetota bacterium]|nr:DUF6498-containing protein [Actinomycetota bacterium]
MRKVAHALIGVAVTAVPAIGWFVDGWSAGTTLVVYWFETVAGCLLVAVRIAAHRRWHPSCGHFRYRARGQHGTGFRASVYLHGFLVTTVVFCVAHGLFLAAMLALLSRTGGQDMASVTWRSAAGGCLIVLALLAVDLAADLPRIDGWSFSQLERIADLSIGRVAVVHLTLVFGMLAIVLTDAPTALFGVFVALRAMYQLSVVLPQWEPATPPAWLRRLMDRLPHAHRGERFEDYWTRDLRTEADRREHNDRPWPDTGHPGTPDRAAPRGH